MVRRAVETGIYSWSRFCSVNHQQQASTSLPIRGQARIPTRIPEFGDEYITIRLQWLLQPVNLYTDDRLCFNVNLLLTFHFVKVICQIKLDDLPIKSTTQTVFACVT